MGRPRPADSLLLHLPRARRRRFRRPGGTQRLGQVDPVPDPGRPPGPHGRRGLPLRQGGEKTLGRGALEAGRLRLHRPIRRRLFHRLRRRRLRALPLHRRAQSPRHEGPRRDRGGHRRGRPRSPRRPPLLRAIRRGKAEGPRRAGDSPGLPPPGPRRAHRLPRRAGQGRGLPHRPRSRPLVRKGRSPLHPRTSTMPCATPTSSG